MVKYKNFEANILVDGQALPEYQEEGQVDGADREPRGPGLRSTTTITRHLQSEVGKNYSVQLSIDSDYRHRRFDTLSATIYVDGTRANGSILQLPTARRTSQTRLVDGHTYKTDEGTWESCKFRFAQLALSADSSSKQVQTSGLRNIGTIEIRFKQGKHTGLVSDQSLHQNDLPQSEEISEKSLKGRAVDVKTKFDDAKTCSARTVYKIDYNKSQPFLIFRFEYGSKEALQQRGIIERPRSPTPLEDRNVETLTLAEHLELNRRLKAQLDAANAKVKQEIKAEVKQETTTTRTAKRTHSATTQDMETFFSSNPDDEIQEMKRPKKTIEVVDLIDE